MAMLYHNQTRAYSLVALIVAAVFFVGCSTTSIGKKSSDAQLANIRKINPRREVTEQDRMRVAAIAQQALGKSSLKVFGKQFRSDCSGTVRAIFTRAKIGLGGIIKGTFENDVKAIYRYVQKYGSIRKNDPSPGDLVFFHNTYDRSRNGRMNDALTHIGIVERVDGTTVHFIHHLGQSIIRSRMDLSKPRETFGTNGNKRINDVLRRAQGTHRAYTAGELFAGFGRL